jgi:hypothetical protein
MLLNNGAVTNLSFYYLSRCKFFLSKVNVIIFYLLLLKTYG